ncbi:MAG: BLUF domain-containing protein [Aquabacterium sp.]|nr:BLUF domain-containing protein [Aquabacterium sp.]
MSPDHRMSLDEPGAGHAYPLLYQLVYCSRAAPGVDDAAVENILRSARRWNPEHGITGLLVFGGGIFFQWLEGPRDNIGALLAKLKADTRHEGIVTLGESEELRERLFPDWDMELVTGADIRDVLQDALDTAQDATSAATLRDLLQRLEAGELSPLADI